jgi:hypothetical protein
MKAHLLAGDILPSPQDIMLILYRLFSNSLESVFLNHLLKPLLLPFDHVMAVLETRADQKGLSTESL